MLGSVFTIGSKRRAEAAANAPSCSPRPAARARRANADDATVDGVVGVVEAEMEKYLAKAEGSVRHERLAGFLKDTMRFAVIFDPASARALRSEAKRATARRRRRRRRRRRKNRVERWRDG